MAQAEPHKSIKHSIIDKANTTMLVAVSIAVFLVVFSVFASRALISQSLYHQRVISKQEEALRALETNRRAADDLRESYVAFATQAINVIGGDPAGDGERDGDNARIVLDALPAEYDFPALSSSIEKILVDGGYQIDSIGGQEDASQNTEQQAESTPTAPAPQANVQASALRSAAAATASQAVEIPYPFSIDASQESIQKLIETLENSIRPFYISSLSLEGQGANLSTSFGLKTFYQPATSLQIGTTEVK